MQVQLKSVVLKLQVCCSQIDIPSESCFSTFHPQNGACSDGLLMIILGLCLVNPFTAFRPRQVKGLHAAH